MTGLKASTLFRAYVDAYLSWYWCDFRIQLGENRFLARRLRRNRQARYFNRKLTAKLEAQEKELSVLKRQVEEFKPAFILQQIRAGNFTEVEDVDD